MPSVSPLKRVKDTPSTARTCADLAAAADLEMLGQVARDQQRLRGATDVARIGSHVAHSRTSIAERMPSLTRLKQIEVTKIATPGNAQDSGTM